MGKKRFKIVHEIAIWTTSGPHVSNVHLCRHPFFSAMLAYKAINGKLIAFVSKSMREPRKFIPSQCLLFLSLKCLGQFIQSVFSPNLRRKLTESEQIEMSFVEFLPHQLIGDEFLPAERAGRQRTNAPEAFAKPGTWSGGDKARVSRAYSEQVSHPPWMLSEGLVFSSVLLFNRH